MTRIATGAVTLDYELRGQGPPLLLINGFRRSRVGWLEPFVQALEPHFRLVLFDNRGTGHSDQPSDGYSIEAFADDCAGLLGALKITRAHVFGASMGGMIAQRVATRHPHQVQGLALGCTNSGKGSVPAEKRIWELLRLLPGPEMDAREVARRQEEAYVVDAFRAEHSDVLQHMFDVNNVNPTPVHAINGHRAAIEAFDGSGDLGKIEAPTLVLTGAEDRLIPAENSRRIAKAIPGARLHLLPESAHLFWVEKPRESAQALVDFFSAME